jgi:hypothetical protein
MRRTLPGILAVALSLALTPASAAPAAKKRGAPKHQVTRHWKGYGFLPGYRPPEIVERDRLVRYWRSHPYRFYGPARPRFYHGRWNGGGFGPCYTSTPIGYIWTCGK